MKYRKKPVELEAIKNEGEWAPIVEWLQQLAGNYPDIFAELYEAVE